MESNNEIDYEIILKFPSLLQAGNFLTELAMWKEEKNKKTEKKLNDLRGQHTKKYHQDARIHKLLHPDLTYAQCMDFVRNWRV